MDHEQKLAPAIVAEIRRLGGELRDPPTSTRVAAGISWYNMETKESWENTDPLGQLKEFSDLVRYLDHGIHWAFDQRYLAPSDINEGEDDEIELCGASENYEYKISDNRVLLYQFAWNMDMQKIFAINVLEHSTDPQVYEFDHDGSGEPYVIYDHLSEFLADLKRPE